MRSFTVTVENGEFLRAKAIDQWTRELPVKAVRGDITDCNGVLLAGSKGTYGVYVRTRSVTDAKSISQTLSNLLNVDKDLLFEKINKKSSSEITVALGVDEQTVKEISQHDLKGVYFSIDNTRVYPYGEMLCQTLGYVSSDGSGQTGLEKYYNEYLKGIDGEILYESDLVGYDVENTNPHYISGINGLSLGLTIDYEIQLICENEARKAMQQYTPKSVQIIVMQPSSGKILALAETPSFDLNQPPRDNLELLLEYGRNRTLSNSYEPGSTFKVITASANVEEYFLGNKKAFSLDYVFPSSRYRVVGGRKIKCWSTHDNGKHSNENLGMALNNSCNPIFVDIALSLGKTTMYEYIKKFNFGKTTGIDFHGEALGMLVPEGAVTEGDLARIGFGQTIAVTPIQLASAVCASVNGGVYYKPYFVEKIYNSEGVVSRNYPIAVNRVISEKASKQIASYLLDVVTSGSGKQAFIEGYAVGGKTGTAQKYENGVISQGKYVMSFVGFFPANNPEYLALVIVDEPIGGTYGSTVAAPICKNVFSQIITGKNIKSVQI